MNSPPNIKLQGDSLVYTHGYQRIRDAQSAHQKFRLNFTFHVEMVLRNFLHLSIGK